MNGSLINKKVLISIFVNPLSSKKKLEYLIKNINNSLVHYDYTYEVTLEFVTWWASELIENLLSEQIHEYSNPARQIKERNCAKFLETQVIPELKEQIYNNIKVFNNIDGTSYENISNIKCNHSFQDDWNFIGYQAETHFELLTDHIEENKDYDFYIFFSSNFLICENAFINMYISRLEKHDVPFLTHNTVVEGETGKYSNYISFPVDQLNTFGCRPAALLDFFNNKISKVYDTSYVYKKQGKKIGLGTIFSNNGSKLIKNYKNVIINPRDMDFLVKKRDLLDTTIFSYADNGWEAAIQFPIFLLIYCIRHQETYNTPLVWNNELQMKIPEYCFDKIYKHLPMDGYIQTNHIPYYMRFEFFKEYYFTQEVIINIISNIDKNLEVKIDFSISNKIEKELDTLIKYLDKAVYITDKKNLDTLFCDYRILELDKILLNDTYPDYYSKVGIKFANLMMDHF